MPHSPYLFPFVITTNRSKIWGNSLICQYTGYKITLNMSEYTKKEYFKFLNLCSFDIQLLKLIIPLLIFFSDIKWFSLSAETTLASFIKTCLSHDYMGVLKEGNVCIKM